MDESSLFPDREGESAARVHVDSQAELFEAMIREFEVLLGCHICIHDLKGLFFDVNGHSLLNQRNIHGSSYCHYGRFIEVQPGWGQRCVQHCQYWVLQKIQARGEHPWLCTHCWKGCREIVVGVVEETEVVLILFAGPYREEQRPFFAGINDRQETELDRLYGHLAPLPAANRQQGIARILFTLGHGLLNMRRLYDHAYEVSTWKERVDLFLRQHAHRRHLSLKDFARHVHLSPGRAGRIVIEHCGRSFRDLLRRERVRRACWILRATDRPLDQIAEDLGFPNVYYFSRVFKEITGVSPGNYRKSSR